MIHWKPVDQTTFAIQQSYSSFTGFGGHAGPSVWVIIMAVVCIIALILPMEGDKRFDLPHYLLLSVNQKLLASFILGNVYLVCISLLLP